MRPKRSNLLDFFQTNKNLVSKQVSSPLSSSLRPRQPRLALRRRMKWKKDHKLPNTKSKLPETLPAATTSSPRLIKKEEHERELDPMLLNDYIKEESCSSDSSN